MKKFLLIMLAVGGLMMAATPSSEAGVSIGFGFGPRYCGYPYPYYGYGYGYPYYGSAVRVVVRPHYHWYHGRRIYCTRVHRHW